ncbi:YtcA family lipoprotein [Pollutimonas bauzanensis]|uniref:YtcA family lipoprotein n=1 Tax=Pollutimonas bauzanensis TaxID=658167 RepID=UPI00333F860A
MPHIATSLLIAIVLAGCTNSNAPSIAAFGSYFPSWLLCAAVGIMGAILVRLGFIHLGLDDALPLRLFVYVCVAIIIAIATSLLFFAT